MRTDKRAPADTRGVTCPSGEIGRRNGPQIAKNCRASVEMIEKYYASHLKNSLDATAINIMRKKTTKKGDTIDSQEG